MTISRLTGSSETYVSRVGELEMPSMFGGWLMIGYVYLLFVLFRDKNGNIGINEKEKSSELQLQNRREIQPEVIENASVSPSFDKTLDGQVNQTRFQPTEYKEYIENKLVKQGDPKRYIEVKFLDEGKIEIFIQFDFRQRASFIEALDSFNHLYKGDDDNYEFIVEYMPYGNLIESLSVSIKNKKMKFVFK